MKKHSLLTKVTRIIVICMGLVPGLATIFLSVENPFQLRVGPVWQSLMVGIPSMVMGIVFGVYLTNYFYKKWFHIEKPVMKKVVLIFSITLVAGILNALMAWELNWIIAKITGWGYLTELPWFNLLIGLPIMMFYCLVPGLIVSLLNGVFSFFYLRTT